jgi:hypothetical protein
MAHWLQTDNTHRNYTPYVKKNIRNEHKINIDTR